MQKYFLFPTQNEIPTAIKSTPHVVSSGPGDHTASTITEICQNLSSSALFVLSGYSGALRPDLKTGDIVICENLQADGLPNLLNPYEHQQALCDKLRLQGVDCRIGSSFSANRVISSIEDKQRLQEQGADVVDMENYHALQAAQQKGHRFLAIRVVLDPYHFILPDLSQTILPDGGISVWKTAKHVIWHPHHIAVLCKIFQLTQIATPSLLKCCEIIKTL